MKSLLVEKIKQKKELRGLADEFVKQELESYLEKTHTPFPLDYKSEKVIIKAVRAELRRYVGRFQSSKKHENLLEAKDYSAILKTHASTRERLPHYEILKKIIHSLKPKTILDIGCGLNPIALAEPGIAYYACDIKEDELKLVESFFKAKGITGRVFFADARTERNFPKTNLALVLKVIDLLDNKGHKRAEELIRSLDCDNIIVSFSTKTLSARPMNHPQRGWIERLATRLGYTFKLIKSPNELFYIIQKHP